MNPAHFQTCIRKLYMLNPLMRHEHNQTLSLSPNTCPLWTSTRATWSRQTNTHTWPLDRNWSARRRRTLQSRHAPTTKNARLDMLLTHNYNTIDKIESVCQRENTSTQNPTTRIRARLKHTTPRHQFNIYTGTPNGLEEYWLEWYHKHTHIDGHQQS